MFPAATNAKGRTTAQRDVCQKDPLLNNEASEDADAELEPHSNVGDNRCMDPYSGTQRVKVQNMIAASTTTRLLNSKCQDETSTGVVNRQTGGAAQIKVGSSRVLFEGAPAAFRSSITANNGLAHANAPCGAQDIPSQSLLYISP